MNKRLVLTIQGRVQGVGYRYSVQNEARKHGFTGYVANQPDGLVLLVVEGPEQDLKNFIDWCYNGVRSARVQKVDQTWSEPTREFSDFVIKF